MRSARFVIVGGGLSGLYAAALLEQHGITDYLLIEARHKPGGRILSLKASGNQASEPATISGAIDRVDLGPTWFQLPGLCRGGGRCGDARHRVHAGPGLNPSTTIEP